MENLIRHPAFQIVLNSVIREARQVLYLSSFAMTFGVALLMISLKFGMLFAGLGAILLILSGWLLYQHNQLKDPEKNPVIQLLRHKKERIVWVYPFITEVMPFGISLFKRCYVIIKLSDGEELSFIINLKEKKLLLKWMKRLLPQAKFGFSKNRENRYGSGPESFLDQEWGRS